jgi:hypothetical protein
MASSVNNISETSNMLSAHIERDLNPRIHVIDEQIQSIDK